MFEITDRIKDTFGLLIMWVGLTMFGYMTSIMQHVNNFLHVTEANANAQIGAVAVVTCYMIVKILYEILKQFTNNGGNNNNNKPKTF